MNFSSPEMSKIAIDSLQHWWALAGVKQHYLDEPSSLLGTIRTTKGQNTVASSPDDIEMPVKKVRQAVADDYPVEIEAFKQWLSKPENLIESRWSGNFSAPYGPDKPQAMVITALPESVSSATDMIYTKDSTALLHKMLSASGYDPEQSHFASLSLSRTPDGQLTVEMLQILKKRMQHYISLVQPERIIVLGDTASKIFFGQDLLTARKKKQFINHLSSKTEAIATFHPRILLQRPEFKAEAWKDLQLILRNPAP